MTTGDVGRITELACSPTADVVAFANHRHELCVLDLDDAKVRVLDTSPAHRIIDIAFSPDGRFLAYVWWPAHGASIVRVVKVKSGKVHDVTSPLRVDHSPAWDPEGKYLFFISTRDFNPVYDALQFDLSFPQASRPFVVTLRSDVPSPFVPKPKPVHRDHDHDHDRDDEKKPDKPVDVEIDFDGIQGRILGFPVEEGEYGQIVAVRERVLFTRFPVKGIKPSRREDRRATTPARCSPTTSSISALRRSPRSATRFGSATTDARWSIARRIVCARSTRCVDLPEDGDEVEAGHRPRPQDRLDRPRTRERRNRPARRMGADVSRSVAPADRTVLGRRHERYRLGSRLRPLQSRCCRASARAASSPTSIWEMQGELGTSHAYEIGGDYRVPPQYQRGFLGADLAWDADRGGYRIERIYRGDSWNRDHDSPLAEPGLDVREGDAIVAVGGKRLSRDVTPDELLVNAAGQGRLRHAALAQGRRAHACS